MAIGISPKLPLTIDADDGAYKLNKTLVETTKQNFKNLVLTNPRERIMDPLFGVGLRTYLFEQNDDSAYTLIAEKIREQASKYMPFIEVLDIDIVGPESTFLPQNGHFLKVRIEYRILPLDVNDILDFFEGIE